jgi:ubiquinone/menaquinone biosynthesis C-methylase UbiE
MKEIDEKIRSFWDRKPCGTNHISQCMGSREYFTEFDRYYEWMYPYLLPFLDLEIMRGKRVLEIGLGSGFTVSRFAKVASICVGLDISRNTLWLNQSRDKLFDLGVNLVQATALNIPVVDDTFDMVVSVGCLHHIPDIQQAIAEIYRVLKPGGIFKGMVYNRNSYRFKVYIPLVRRLSTRWRGKDWQACVNEMYDSPDNPYGMVYSQKEIRMLFERFTEITFQVENFVGEELLHRVGRFVPRSFWLATLGKIAGLDLYFTARAIK